MFETLDLIPWHEVSHAYGRATDAPKWIRTLNSEDGGLRAEAVMHFLWSSMVHQYTLYPATPFVIPFVLEALGSSSLSQRDDGICDPMAFNLLQFLRCCAECGQRAILGNPHPKAATVEQAVAAGAGVYESYLDDLHPAIKMDAEWLLRFVIEQSKPDGGGVGA